MKTWQKYLFIYIPIGIFCCLINFCAKKDNKTPYAEYHLFNDFEKNEYSVKDLYTATTIGEFIFSNDNEQSFFDFYAEEISGSYMVGSRENYYQYPKIELNKIKIEKIKCKNWGFYIGKVGEWHSVVIMSLDNHDYQDFYKSQNRKRYLFFLLKNGDYNFSTKDASVYNLYACNGVYYRKHDFLQFWLPLEVNYITSLFGIRSDATPRKHDGLDFRAKKETPVKIVSGGLVTIADLEYAGSNSKASYLIVSVNSDERGV